MVKPVRRINHRRMKPKAKHDPSPSPYALPLPPSTREQELHDKLDAEKDRRIEDLKQVIESKSKSSDEKTGITVIKIIFNMIDLSTWYGKLIFLLIIIGTLILIGGGTVKYLFT